jgi:hypothetical protein
VSRAHCGCCRRSTRHSPTGGFRIRRSGRSLALRRSAMKRSWWRSRCVRAPHTSRRIADDCAMATRTAPQSTPGGCTNRALSRGAFAKTVRGQSRWSCRKQNSNSCCRRWSTSGVRFREIRRDRCSPKARTPCFRWRAMRWQEVRIVARLRTATRCWCTLMQRR